MRISHLRFAEKLLPLCC